MAFRIYTRTGDLGATGLIGGTRVPKSHIRIEAYGTIDELNSFTGMARDQLQHEDSRKALLEIQDRLFTIGSALASDPEKEIKMALPALNVEDIRFLEEEIDRMDDLLPPMRSFILPGGNTAVSSIHIARCVCRRAERHCVGMQHAGEPLSPGIIIYLNRLSDYFFTLARFIAMETGAEEIPWKARV